MYLCRIPKLLRWTTALLLLASEWQSCAWSVEKPTEEANVLSAREAKEGWHLLFDGKSLKGWHTFNAEGISPRWHVRDGELVLEPSPTRKISGADLETEQRFGDFELSIEWKMSPGGNGGIFCRVRGTGFAHPWEAAPEYQLLDNHAGDDPPIHQTASVWDLYAPTGDATRPIGEFNHTVIRMKGHHVEHWLNNVRVLSYELGSADFNARHAKSVYRTNPRFGVPAVGTIVLQDEGRLISFRNIKIRRLK